MSERTADSMIYRVAVVFIVNCGAIISVQAQDIPEGIGVADRPRPELQPVGGRIGSFLIYPEFTGSLEADDNVFASSTDKHSDVIGVAEPSVSVKSLWRQHSLQGSGYFRRTQFASNSTETVDEYGGEFTARYDIDGTDNVRMQANARHEAERRYNLSSEATAVTPLVYDEVGGTLSVTKQFGQIRIEASGAIRSLNYANNVTRAGLFIDARIRNSTVSNGIVSIKYVSKSAVNAFFRGQIDKRSFPFGPGKPGFDPQTNLDRDSFGGKIEGGLSVELKGRLYGNVRLGYLLQDYVDPRLRDVSSFSYGADLLWNPSRLTSVRLAIDRAVSPVTSTRDAGLFRTRYSLVASHELRRNLILTASGEYSTIAPIGPSASSRETELGAGIEYVANRLVSAQVGFIHRARSGNENRLHYSANRAIASIRIRL